MFPYKKRCYPCSEKPYPGRKGLLTDKIKKFLYDKDVDVGDQVYLHHEDERM